MKKEILRPMNIYYEIFVDDHDIYIYIYIWVSKHRSILPSDNIVCNTEVLHMQNTEVLYQGLHMQNTEVYV